MEPSIKAAPAATNSARPKAAEQAPAALVRELAEALTPEQREHWDFGKARVEKDGTVVIPGRYGGADIAITPTAEYLKNNPDSAGHVEVVKGKERIVFPSAIFDSRETSLLLDTPAYRALYTGLSESDARKGAVVHELSHYIKGSSEYGAYKDQFEFYSQRTHRTDKRIPDEMIPALIYQAQYSLPEYLQARIEHNGFKLPSDLKDTLPGGSSWRAMQQQLLDSGTLSENERKEVLRLLALSKEELNKDPAVLTILRNTADMLAKQVAAQELNISSPQERVAFENGRAKKNSPRLQQYEAKRREAADRFERELRLAMQ